MQWDYLEIDFNELKTRGRQIVSRIDLLKEAGSAGWELVGIHVGIGVFKRPIPAVKAANPKRSGS